MKIIKVILIILIIILFQGCMNNSNYLNLEQLQEKAIQDDEQAQYKLAIYYENKKNFSEALIWYEKSASKEYSLAQNELGNIYLQGNLGLNKDFDKAFVYYEKASNNGYYDAINNLGYMYDLGLGIKQNRVKAIELYELAALKGSIRAMYNLGISYKEGQGVEKNIILSYKWLDLARYYTTNSKDMNLKWSIRKKFDELDSTMNSSQKEEAKALAEKWYKSNIN